MKQLRRDGPLYIFAIAANATDVLIAAMAIVHRLMGVTRHIKITGDLVLPSSVHAMPDGRDAERTLAFRRDYLKMLPILQSASHWFQPNKSAL